MTPLHRKALWAALALTLAAPLALAQDAVSQLRAFAQASKAGEARFTQTVTSPDGKRVKTSSGTLAFERPGRFRFDYTKPYPQTIVCDGADLWFHDPDLNQVTVRKAGDALGSTPAAILLGANLDQAFALKSLPDADGQRWAEAVPKQADGQVRQIKVGFKGEQIATIELADAFGQRSVLVLDGYKAQASLPAGAFTFTPPKGADVTRQ